MKSEIQNVYENFNNLYSVILFSCSKNFSSGYLQQVAVMAQNNHFESVERYAWVGIAVSTLPTEVTLV